MSIKKVLYIILGCIGVGLGAVGAVLPLLPSFPFLLLAAFCFARSSEKLNNWFINTKLYKENLESYVQGQGHDTQNQGAYHGHGYPAYVHRLCHDARGAGGPDRAGLCVGVSYSLLLLGCQDYPGAKSGKVTILFQR